MEIASDSTRIAELEAALIQSLAETAKLATEVGALAKTIGALFAQQSARIDLIDQQIDLLVHGDDQ